ncbi:MAG: AtpZ/AtpI family protein [Pyrinomonadaceae bacterium]
MIDQEEPEKQQTRTTDVEADGFSDGGLDAAVRNDADPQVDRVEYGFPPSDELAATDSRTPDAFASPFDEPASARRTSSAGDFQSPQPDSNWDLSASSLKPIRSLPQAQYESQPEMPLELPFVPVTYVPEAPQEAVRQTGLAWSMGIVFFGSVAFMLFLGWLADLLLGSSPWGIVLGVVIGSGIGFVQFFRISSQMHAPKTPDNRSFLSKDE